MPITFGAVGDIISVCLLVKDLVEALDKARGSKAEYQAAIRELWILDRALLEIDLLMRQHGDGSTPELRSLCETGKRAVARCQGLVSTFLGRIRKYQSSLGENQKPNLVKEVTAAVRWRIGEKEALEQFRVEIVGTSSSLQMLLATASVTLLTLNRKEMSEKLDEAERRNDIANIAQHTALDCIKDRIENANQNIEAGNTILGKISETLRLDWLRQLGSELKTLMWRAMAVNISTYQAVIRLQTSLPSRLEGGLIEEPVILEDPLGRIAPVHLQFITSWDAFNSVLESRFQNIQGLKKVKQRDYGLQERGTGREIEQSRLWQSAFLPGQRVEMSFIFHLDEPTGHGDNTVTCPGCQTPSHTTTSDTDVRCKTCQMSFRRITRLENESLAINVVAKPKAAIKKPRDTVTTRRKRTLPDDFEEEVDLRNFRRVRLISTMKRGPDKTFLNTWYTDHRAREVVLPDLTTRLSKEYSTLIEWEGPGERVYVTGTFAGWNRKYKLHRNGPSKKKDVLSAYVSVTPGTHHLAFLVDKTMRTSDKLPTTVDYTNILVNYIEVPYPELHPLPVSPAATNNALDAAL